MALEAAEQSPSLQVVPFGATGQVGEVYRSARKKITDFLQEARFDFLIRVQTQNPIPARVPDSFIDRDREATVLRKGNQVDAEFSGH